MSDSLPGFNGERPDPICGVTHLGNGYRAYHPLLMRFTCPDDLSPFGAGGINPYAYCVGDPINRADPSGHVSAGSLFGILAGVIGGVMLGVFTAGLALPATLAIDAAFTVAVTGAAMGIDHQRLSSMSGEDWGVVIGGSVLASVGGAIAGKVLGSLKGARGRPFGGLMMEGDEACSGGAAASRSYSESLSEEVASNSTGLNSSMEYEPFIGQGAGGKVFKDTEGFLRKDFHGMSFSRKDFIQNELAIFRRVYGEESAELIGPNQKSMRMWEIPGKPLDIDLVATLNAGDRARLYDSLNHLHTLGIYHGDLKQTNILFDSTNRRFNFIDFGLSRMTSEHNLLTKEKSKFLELIAGWPVAS